MTVRARWLVKLRIRLALLRSARARAAYWRRRKASARHGTSAYSHAGAMLAEREKLVAHREDQVAYARRVIARHTPHAQHTSDRGVHLICEFEGCRLKPYQDSVGVWTIGYGHTHGVGPHTAPLASEADARALLKRDLAETYEPPVRALRRRLTQGQFDALVSIVYNVGPGILDGGHTLGDALRRGDMRAAADAFLLYDKAGGQTLPGLARRRHAERQLFLGG